MDELIAERIRSVIRRHDHLNLTLRIAEERFENDTPIAGQLAGRFGQQRLQYAFDRKRIATEHAQNDAYIGLTIGMTANTAIVLVIIVVVVFVLLLLVVVIFVVAGSFVAESNAFDEMVE